MPLENILIVEDDEPLAHAVGELLKRLGYVVVGIADSGDAALRLAVGRRPDLALMDIEILGRMDGFQVAETLRRQHNVPVIFLTGRADDETLERVRGSGSFGYLRKPFRQEELKTGIELALIRHRRESHLQRREESFAAAIQSTEDAVFLATPEGRVTFLNPAAERLTGWSTGRALGKPLADVVDLNGDGAGLEAVIRAATQGEFMHEMVLRTRTGQLVPVEVSASRVRDGIRGDCGAVLVVRNVTARKQYEAGLKRSEKELRSLAGHLEGAREAERTRIAREIHDELGQLLTGFKFDLAWVEKKLVAQPALPETGVLDKVRAMTSQVGEMVQCVRRISAELRPGILDELGLAAAVEWQAGDFQKRTGIRAHVGAELSDRPLPREVVTALFRVLQESLTNVARHAEARNVRIRLREEDAQLVLQVADDGRGITDEELGKTGVFGLMGMRERILPLRGQCNVRGAAGCGTTVRVTVPLGALEGGEP